MWKKWALMGGFCLNVFFNPALANPKVTLGNENLFTAPYGKLLKGKRVGLLTNHTGIDGRLEPTSTKLKRKARGWGFELTALYSPEHGISGAGHAWEKIQDGKDSDGIPVYSLHGKTRAPTPDMLEGVDVILYDIQDIGSRSYTYVSTLFLMMEQAAQQGKAVVVLDRPNPINGLVVDGPMLDPKWRSYVGYVNVPYCHGMTVGELAQLFNSEYNVGCDLTVVPMSGWKRSLSFRETGLPWIPTSPHIPESDTPFYYPATGILGELQIVNIGVGYTLPFKLVGAPWIKGQELAYKLNEQNLPGVHFQPFHFKPFYGRFSGENCQGVLIVVTDQIAYLPVATQYLILGTLKTLYRDRFEDSLQKSRHRQEMFAKVNGTEEVFRILSEEENVVWKLQHLDAEKRKEFKKNRRKYLIKAYG